MHVAGRRVREVALLLVLARSPPSAATVILSFALPATRVLLVALPRGVDDGLHRVVDHRRGQLLDAAGRLRPRRPRRARRPAAHAFLSASTGLDGGDRHDDRAVARREHAIRDDVERDAVLAAVAPPRLRGELDDAARRAPSRPRCVHMLAVASSANVRALS